MNLNALNVILADAAATSSGTANAQPNQTGQMLNMVLMMGGMFAILYLLMIRPQAKKQKELAAKLSSLKPGDKVVTSSGIIGTVVAIKDRTLSMRSADTKIEILKSAVSDITERSGEATTAE
jgi:preprotein translocase subunit YajC